MWWCHLPHGYFPTHARIVFCTALISYYSHIAARVHERPCEINSVILPCPRESVQMCLWIFMCSPAAVSTDFTQCCKQNWVCCPSQYNWAFTELDSYYQLVSDVSWPLSLPKNIVGHLIQTSWLFKYIKINDITDLAIMQLQAYSSKAYFGWSVRQSGDVCPNSILHSHSKQVM